MDKFCRAIRHEIGLQTYSLPTPRNTAADESVWPNRVNDSTPQMSDWIFNAIDANRDGVNDGGKWDATFHNSRKHRTSNQQPPSRIVPDVDMVKRVVRRIFRKVTA